MPRQQGFTLIEIIAVLVILGILAAIAVPKYLDIQDSARVKSAQAAVSEIKTRASLAFAKALMDGTGVAPNINAVNGNINADVGPDYNVTVAVDGNNLVITVDKVLNTALTANIAGNWILPQ